MNIPNSMEKLALYLGYFSILFEKITFYTEILTGKVEFRICSLVSLVKKHHKATFLVKISVQKITIKRITSYIFTFYFKIPKNTTVKKNIVWFPSAANKCIVFSLSFMICALTVVNYYFLCQLVLFLKILNKVTQQIAKMFDQFWAQSLMVDLRQDINRVSSFSRCLNGTFS